jgi:hypothetical protein
MDRSWLDTCTMIRVEVFIVRLRSALFLAFPAAWLVITACSDPVYQKIDNGTGEGDKSASEGNDTNQQSGNGDGTGSGDGTGTGKGDGGGSGSKTDGGNTKPSTTNCANTATRSECLSCCVKNLTGSGGGGLLDCICKDKCADVCKDSLICGAQGNFNEDCGKCLQENAQGCFQPAADSCSQCESKPN